MASAPEISEDEEEELFITQDIFKQAPLIELLSDDEEPILLSSDESESMDVETASPKKENILPNVTSETKCEHGSADVRHIAGVQVHFPVKPYPSQIVLMNKVITGIKKSENCLLESPTGSGKTLALLCAALAWQAQDQERLKKEFEASLQSPRKKLFAPPPPAARDEREAPAKVDFQKIFAKKNLGSIYQQTAEQTSPCEVESESGNQPEVAPPPSPSQNDSAVAEAQTSPELVTIYKRQRALDTSDQEEEQRQTYRSSRVFYGARTHKQLAQAAAELQRTRYGARVHMSVLASREHACIQPLDRSAYTSLSDMCRTLRKKATSDIEDSQRGGCEYYGNSDKLVAAMHGTWDLEQLVSAGRQRRACPYYAARTAAQVADIVFCPYNYLIDPEIRRSMQISLDDDVVILDEAHNIEEVCRSAASVNIARDLLIMAINELDVVQRRGVPEFLVAHITHIQTVLRRWDDWFRNHEIIVNQKPMQDGEAVHTWEIAHFMLTLNNHNLGEMHYRDFQTSANKLQMCLMDEPKFLLGVSQGTGILIDTITRALGYLFRDNCKYADDFKPALAKKLHGGSGEGAVSSSGWKSTQNTQALESHSSYGLQLLCLNPAVVFAELQNARCIVLSSGTLTPIASMHSELGTQFPHQYSARHVIPAERVWIGSIHTSGMERLECSSSKMSEPRLQKELGEVLLSVCSVTPGGVLCFLPSYSRLNELKRRWQATGLWRKLTNTKYVFMESKNMRDHDDTMAEYYERVAGDRGALLLAVYRGKVSEGMDFKDRQARAVVAVGIPYPNIGGLDVKSKRAYNDQHTERGLLPSNEWLRVQAYRALNQAVGRCVRHRGDWGAVLLVDARFSQPYHTEHLSKWVREFLSNNHHTLDTLIDSKTGMKAFMDRMSALEP